VAAALAGWALGRQVPPGGGRPRRRDEQRRQGGGQEGVQARSAVRQTAMWALWSESSAQTPAQVTASEDEIVAATSAAASREGGA
jgi:hypothetical protein